MAGSGTRVVGRAPRGWAHDERGSVLIFTAAALAALVGAVALSVDIGNLSYNKRNLQTISDAAAMDARFALNQGASSCAQAVTLADQSALNNNFDPTASGNSLTVTLGTTNVVSDTVTLGTTKEIIEHDHFVPDPASCTVPGADPAQAAASAVQVQTTGNVAFFFAPGSATPAATAVWSANGGVPETGVSIGTDLATLNSADSALLNPLLNDFFGSGSAINLSAVGYQGLAGGSVTLGQLATALDVGSVSALLTDKISYSQLLNATLTALSNNPNDPNATAAITALNGLINQTAGLSVLPQQITLGSFLDIKDPGSISAASVQANILNLIVASAEAGNGQHTIQLDNLGINLAGLVGISGSANIITPPVTAYGPVGTSASEAQVGVTLDVEVDVLGLTDVTVPLSITAASGKATLLTIPCGGTPPGPTAPPAIGVQTGTLAATLPASGIDISVLGLGLVNVTGTIGVGSGGTSTTLNGPYDPTETIPGEQSLSFSSTNLTASLLGTPLPIGTIADPLIGVLDGLLVPVINPLLDLLGVNVGSATVGNPGPTICGNPSGGFLY